jgi:hypothetical protein
VKPFIPQGFPAVPKFIAMGLGGPTFPITNLLSAGTKYWKIVQSQGTIIDIIYVLGKSPSIEMKIVH